MTTRPLVIDPEAHFFTQSTVDYLIKRDVNPKLEPIDSNGSYNLRFNEKSYLPHKKNLMDRLLDIGSGRIAEMDANGVDVQILSLTVPSGIECMDNQDAPTLAKDSNDELHAAIQQYPDRLRGFAAIAPHDVKQATVELERCITQLNFSGWLTHSNFGQGDYLDNKKYWPLLELAESLDIPIYLHPTVANIKEVNDYGFATAGPALGFQFDTALCLMRMILAGVFDQFPKLKVVLGHLGETLVYIYERLDFMYNKADLKEDRPDLQRLPSEVIANNVYVTTSGRFHHPAIDYIIKTLGAGKLLFASDYPMESLKEASDFIRAHEVDQSTLIKIMGLNAKEIGLV